MAKHQLLLDDFYDSSFSLIAIHCRLEDYRLAYLINKHLGTNLSRLRQDLDYKFFEATYAIYQWDDVNQLTTWSLVSNVCKIEKAGLQSSGSLFSTSESTLKTYHLLPEFKKVDFLMKINSDDDLVDTKPILEKLQSIPQLLTSYAIDIEKIKSKDNLIF